MATSTHRKIDLQSTGDLAYLHRNMQAAARQKLDLHFPPEAALSDGGLEGGGGDSLRGRVEGEVLMFLTQTISHAKQNLTINGLDLPSPSAQAPLDGREDGSGPEDVEYEAYDARLASKLQTLYLALESETMAVARLRRDAPRRAAEGWRVRFLEGGDGGGCEEEGGEKMEVDSEAAVGMLGDLEMGMGMGMGEERWEGVRDMYAVACEGLVGLKAGMTETVGRCERAGRVVAEVERG